MQIAFRVDASLDIGTGHVVRCLTLADALSKKSAFCIFICRNHHGNLNGMIREHGYKVISLPEPINNTHKLSTNTISETTHSTWLGVDYETDAEETKTILNDYDIDLLIVDHYAIDYMWEQSIRSYVKQLFVIDDLADRRHNCDFLLDQNLGRKKINYQSLVPHNCTLLIGPKYALLRPEFHALREYSLERRSSPHLRSILIFMGGIDKDNITEYVLNTLYNSKLPENCGITVVMGRNSPWIDSVRSKAKDLPWSTDVKCDVSNMAQLMADSDLAIGAAGSSSWERCCLGLPTIQIILASNQEIIAKSLEDTGAVITADTETLRNQLFDLFSRIDINSELFKMSTIARTITNGKGIDYISDTIMGDNA